jgi:transposase-like protein
LIEVNEEGIGALADGTEVIAVKAYAVKMGVNPATLEKWIQAAGLTAIEGTQGRRGSHPVALYDKTSVDAVIERKKASME